MPYPLSIRQIAYVPENTVTESRVKFHHQADFAPSPPFSYVGRGHEEPKGWKPHTTYRGFTGIYLRKSASISPRRISGLQFGLFSLLREISIRASPLPVTPRPPP